MPLILPTHSTTTWRPLSDDVIVVAGSRTATVRFDVLDQTERVRGALLGVEASGSSLTWNARTAVKGSGTLSVIDLDEEWLRSAAVNWLNARIRPVVTIEGYSRPVPLGVWLPSVPTDELGDGTRHWSVELVDKTALLDREVWTSDDGRPVTFVVRAGERVVDVVTRLLGRVGETPTVNGDGSWNPVIKRELVWEPGTTLLKIANQLLSWSNAYSLWCDGWGRFQVSPYVEPVHREPAYAAIGAFRAGETSVVSPQMTLEHDVYSVPNRFVAVGQASEGAPALVGTAVVTDTASPFHYANRGRWITEVESGVEAVDQNSLDSYARRKLADRVSVATRIALKHLWLPDLRMNSVVRLQNPANGLDVLTTVQTIEMPLDMTELCSTTLREALGVGEEVVDDVDDGE